MHTKKIYFLCVSNALWKGIDRYFTDIGLSGRDALLHAEFTLDGYDHDLY